MELWATRCGVSRGSSIVIRPPSLFHAVRWAARGGDSFGSSIVIRKPPHVRHHPPVTKHQQPTTTKSPAPALQQDAVKARGTILHPSSHPFRSRPRIAVPFGSGANVQLPSVLHVFRGNVRRHGSERIARVVALS